MKIHFLAIAIILASIAVIPTAAAQTPARELAQQGKSLVESGNDEAGCPMLQQAWRMDGELLGVGFSVAECYERAGKLASAHMQFLTIAQKANARGEARAGEAQLRADALVPRISTLKLVITPAVASAPGIEITLQSRRLAEAELNTGLRLDGGKHAVVLRATGHAPWSRVVDLPAEGAHLELTLSLGEAIPLKAATAALITERGAAGNVPSNAIPPLRSGGIAGVAAGGVGVVLGITFGVLAMQRRDESNNPGLCVEEARSCATAEGVELRTESRLFGDVSTAMFVMGAGGIAAGIVMLTFSLDADASIQAALGPRSLNLMGTF